jgi:hypothetical protein
MDGFAASFPKLPAEVDAGRTGLGGAVRIRMTPGDRQRRYRDRRRRGVRVYLVEFPDVVLAALLDARLITEFDALDPAKVAVLIARLAKAEIKKTVMRYAAGQKSVR